MLAITAEWITAARSGDHARAWAISERVLAARDPRTRDDPALPHHLRWVWDGRAFDGRQVLVRCYHGLGDTIQFARYLPLLRQRAASVTLEVQPRLAALLAQIEGVDRIVAFDPARPSPESECDLEITELAFALRTPPSRRQPPYLRARPAVLPQGAIGVCHRAGEWDPDRSLPASLLRPVCAAKPCVTLVSGQMDLPVLNPEGCPFDVAATAGLIAGAELVITVDTFVAHLAGALGRPTWLLLKHDPDWRWPVRSRRSDWYPAHRLYAQPRPGDWDAVMAEVLRDLSASDERALADRGSR